jgi:hypothetical protein
MEKEKYRVAEGVTWVNGAKTPGDSIVELTPAQAAYDLGIGRIELMVAVAEPKAKAGK